MKRLYALLFAFGMLLSVGVQAQNGFVVSVTIPDDIEEFPNQEVLIPVYVDFSNAEAPGVGSVELTISFDESVLTNFHGIENEAWMEGGWQWGIPEDGKIKMNAENFQQATTLNGRLLNLRFTYAGGESALTFEGKNAPGESEVGLAGESSPQKNGAANPVSTDFQDGFISERTAPIPVSDWALFLGMGLIAIFLVGRAVRIL